MNPLRSACRSARAAAPAATTAALLAVTLALVACASHPADAQWSAPGLAGTPLRGARVLVVCEAAEAVLARLCLDRLAAEVQARGATAVRGSDVPGAARDDAAYLAQARASNASALWVASIAPEIAAADERPQGGFSIGLGGFSGGGGSGGGVGVGLSLPVGGGGAAAPRYAANAKVSDVASGRLLWTARAGSEGAADVQGQIDALLPRLVGAADGRLF